jgi:hypothetical protein
MRVNGRSGKGAIDPAIEARERDALETYHATRRKAYAAGDAGDSETRRRLLIEAQLTLNATRAKIDKARRRYQRSKRHPNLKAAVAQRSRARAALRPRAATAPRLRVAQAPVAPGNVAREHHSRPTPAASRSSGDGNDRPEPPREPRLCALEGCDADLDALGRRRDADYCSAKHRLDAWRAEQSYWEDDDPELARMLREEAAEAPRVKPPSQKAEPAPTSKRAGFIHLVRDGARLFEVNDQGYSFDLNGRSEAWRERALAAAQDDDQPMPAGPRGGRVYVQVPV